MIPIPNGLVNESSGILAQNTFGVKAENMAIIFHILRSQIYSDKPRAVVREISTNANDSHIASGKKGLPIQVFLPTHLEPFLKIRDFGNGLTDEEVLNVYTSYGESTKRADTEQNGMLGIGCKSPFCYSDSFIVNSVKNGILTVFNAYLEPSNEGKMAQVAKDITTEPDGIEVVIPIRSPDIYEFRSRAMDVYAYFDTLPNITNITVDETKSLMETREAPTTFQGNGWKYLGASRPSLVVMGNVAYPLNANVFTDSDIREEFRTLLEDGLILNLKNGEVEFSASREQLNYSEMTKKAIISKLNAIADELIIKCNATFTSCQTLWEAKQRFSDTFGLFGTMHKFRRLFKNSLAFKGFPISELGFSTQGMADNDVICWQYREQDGKRIVRNRCSELEVGPKKLIVVNDTGIVNGIVNRLIGCIKGPNHYDVVYLLSFLSDTVRDKWIADTGFDAPMISLHTLPKEPMVKYYARIVGANGQVHNPKHVSKEFVFSGTNKRRFSHARSDFWDSTTIDLANDAGIFLAIEKFSYIGSCGTSCHPHTLNEIIELLKAVGIPVPSILGLKGISAQKAKNNSLMIPFFQWLEQTVADFITANPNLETQWANRKYLRSTVGNWQSDLFFKAIAKWKILSSNHPLAQLCDKVEQLHKFSESQLYNLGTLMDKTGYKITKPCAFDLRAEYRTMVARYPILFNIGQHVTLEGMWAKELENYVLMVDMCTS